MSITRRWSPEAPSTRDDVAVERAPGGSRPVVRALNDTDAAQSDTSARLEKVAARALEIGLQRIQLVAWRDLADTEAGGSELHAHRIMSLWADSGLDVTLHTSMAQGLGRMDERDGYRVDRRWGRYAVFPRTVLRELTRRRGRPDGVVEIWNGMPFLSPVWASAPRIVFLHHVHGEMWRMVLPRPLAKFGELVESRIAPPLYRSSRVVTLSSSSRDEIVSRLGLDTDRVIVAPPGVDPMFSPGGTKAAHPFVLAVGRLVPVKRFEILIDALIEARSSVPGLRAAIVGEGYERSNLEARIRAAGATDWIELPGRVSDDQLRDLYRRAWVVASTSQREGWNMTLTEAAACSTPAVATDIVGHSDAVVHGRSGLLADPGAPFAGALVQVLTDAPLRDHLGRGALVRARALTWESTAATTLQALVVEAEARL